MADLATPAPESSLFYLNMAQGIRMKYPATWEKQEDAGQFGFMVIFLSPREDPSDKFRENVSLVIQAVPPEISLEQYTDANREQLLQLRPLTFVEGPVKDQLGNLPAYRSVYTGPIPGGFAGKYLQSFALKGERGFTFTYTAEAAKYDKFMPMVKEIAGSLEVKW